MGQSNRPLARKRPIYLKKLNELKEEFTAATKRHNSPQGCPYTKRVLEAVTGHIARVTDTLNRTEPASDLARDIAKRKARAQSPILKSPYSAASFLVSAGADYEDALHFCAYAEERKSSEWSQIIEVNRWYQMAEEEPEEQKVHRKLDASIPPLANDFLPELLESADNMDPTSHGYPDHVHLVKDWVHKTVNSTDTLKTLVQSAQVPGCLSYSCDVPSQICDCTVHSSVRHMEFALSIADRHYASLEALRWCGCKYTSHKDSCRHAVLVHGKWNCPRGFVSHPEGATNTMHRNRQLPSIVIEDKIFPGCYFPSLAASLQNVRDDFELLLPHSVAEAVILNAVKGPSTEMYPSSNPNDPAVKRFQKALTQIESSDVLQNAFDNFRSDTAGQSCT